jgi:hypothetical protein
MPGGGGHLQSWVHYKEQISNTGPHGLSIIHDKTVIFLGMSKQYQAKPLIVQQLFSGSYNYFCDSSMNLNLLTCSVTKSPQFDYMHEDYTNARVINHSSDIYYLISIQVQKCARRKNQLDVW